MISGIEIDLLFDIFNLIIFYFYVNYEYFSKISIVQFLLFSLIELMQNQKVVCVYITIRIYTVFSM